ncbi:hypothetical protein M0R45_009729 [Rubus argutus]
MTVGDHNSVIDAIRMERVYSGERPYCAYIVFRYASFVTRILGGKPTMIFRIHRFTVFGRKYEQNLEEFNKFHNIDRRLFSRLIYDLRRDGSQSALVMALWMSFEHTSKEFNNLVNKALALPNTKLNAMADETLMVLNCIISDNIQSAPEMPKLQAISESPVTLKFFHDNRLMIIGGVTEFLKDVCVRAFEDFPCQPCHHVKAETLRNLKLKDDGDEQERTLFLTFSKGFPISENEVRECFTREFGDVVDHIYMQEVKDKNQQPLFAQLVVRSASLIQVVLDGRSKVYLSINGKHIRAKKSVPKNRPAQSKSPQPSSPQNLIAFDPPPTQPSSS